MPRRSATVHVHLSGADLARIDLEARAAGVARSKLLRDAALEFFRLRDEHLAGLAATGESDERRAGALLHSMLAEHEQRLAATIDRQAEVLARIRDDVQVLAAMMTAFVRLYLAHTPEPAEELVLAQTSSAQRRFSRWQAAVDRELEARVSARPLPGALRVAPDEGDEVSPGEREEDAQ